MTKQTGDVLADADARLAAAGWHVETTRNGSWITSQWVGPDGRPDNAEFVRLVHGEQAAEWYRAGQQRREASRVGGAATTPVAQQPKRRRTLVVDLLLLAGVCLLVAQLVRVAAYVWSVWG